MKRVLVTGGAGFVGSHLCERLLGEGNEVICMDNFFTGKKRKILHLLDNPYFELIRHDVTMPYFIEVDEIYNLACPASPVHYQYNPIKTIKTSVMGAINMLGLAKRVKAKILQASTSEVYGDPTVHPQSEDYWDMSIRSGSVPVMMRGSVVRNPFSSITGRRTTYASKSSGFSTPMVHGWSPTTAGWSLTSSFRRYKTGTSPFSGMAGRPAAFSMLPTCWKVWSG